MDVISPGPLALEVLEREEVGRALAEHDFATAFALFKKWGGLSQNKIASACQLTPGKVSNIISGQQQVTAFTVICRISDGLCIPGPMLGLARRPWEAKPDEQQQAVEPERRTPTGETPWNPDRTVELAADVTRSDLVMDRRAATRALAGAAVTGSGLLNSLEGWMQPAAAVVPRLRRGRLGENDIEQLERTTRHFRSWDHQYGGGLRRKAVVGQLNEVASNLEEQQRPDVERRLYRVMAQLSGTAATMAWDLGQQRQAQQYYVLALRSAHAGGDTVFGANVLAGMARQMLYRDRPQDALDLVRLAQDGARHELGPRVRAMLHTREAWCYAAQGRPGAFHRATGQAVDALADADDGEEPYWIHYFDRAELAGVTGGRLLDMARTDPRAHAETAAAEIRQALAARGVEASRSHALDWIGLAECSFLAGDVSDAADYTYRAVEAASLTRSGRVRRKLGSLYPYTVGRSSSPSVRGARDSIRDLLAS
ncbi:hypothetical protein OG204_15860 [Streptomyces sp. NBC_01387]|uniref:hypothetical protein n=1 Tax=unclassified Streptomyces TaxID=2593676 RepID=UPI002024085D|nr:MULTISPECIES: hypothetical protein [unclassified Streptomyces]WSC21650.1 hypothetical protein OIE60_19300 [Streptomyces sp. NBC_01766]